MKAIIVCFLVFMTVASLHAQERLPVIDMHLHASRPADVVQPVGEVQMSDPLAPGEHKAELRGVRIWYLVRGSGSVLLIQPGGAGWGGDCDGRRRPAGCAGRIPPHA